MKDFTLNNSLRIPSLGLGTYKMADDESTSKTVAFALTNGYDSVDCASYYANQTAVGKGIRESGRARSEIFVTSKIWRNEMGYDKTMRAFEKTIGELRTDYLDLYLIHWPTADEENLSSWRALESLVSQGAVRSIGVSNFNVNQLEFLSEQAEIQPAVNQIEYHPGLSQPEISGFCQERGILVEAWSPLARGRVFNNPQIQEIAGKYEKTVAQVCLRWEFQHGVRPIPKSTDPQRLLQNLDIFDFSLTPAEMLTLDNLTCPT